MDIRSYFKPLSAKPSQSHSKKVIQIDSSDDDIISATPKKTQKKEIKKRKANVINDSDSEDDFRKSLKKPKPNQGKNETKLKKANALEILGTEPVKQAEVKENVKKDGHHNKNNSKAVSTEIGIHDDKDFEKSLLDLDEDFLVDNVDALDKTIEEALDTGKAHDESDNVDKEKTTENEIGKAKKKISKEGIHSSEEDEATPRKKKKENVHNSEHYDMDPDQERYEKRVHSAMLYKKYLNRGGPAHHGSKELPKGKSDCLSGLCFLRTGVLDSLESAEFEQLIQEHGGRVVHAVSKKVNYVVVGEEPGPSKLEKARNYCIPTISEDELLDMIRIKSGMKPFYTTGESDTLSSSSQDTSTKGDSHGSPQRKVISPEKKIKSPERKAKSPEKKAKSPERKAKLPEKAKSPERKAKSPERKSKSSERKSKSPKLEIKSFKGDKYLDKNKMTLSKPNLKKIGEKIHNGHSLNDAQKEVDEKIEENVENSKLLGDDLKTKKTEMGNEHPTATNLCLTEKYKPQTVKGIVGQQGEHSNMRKLMTWLTNWHKYHGGKNKPKLMRPSPWAKSDNGAFFKAALLSGSPGVGKTTTATLVAKELGFDVVEFNASDTRSKKLLHEEVSQLLSTKSIAGYVADGHKPTAKRVLLMDEVDGMAGNEDRGGMQELISLIKGSSVPIICMCNDRTHPKVRSLANYCFDLRFQRPRLEQIRSFLLTVCCRENLSVPPAALSEIISGTGMDIRQALNNLSMWAAGNKSLSVETAKKEAQLAKKDTVLGQWEVCRKVFTKQEHKDMSIADRARWFFYDYSLAPLFIQENYLQVVPDAPKNQILARVAKTSDALSFGDIIDSKIRSNNSWSLLEVEAMYFSVIPGSYMAGHVGGQINFPSWLGKNSKRNKFHRIATDIQAHMRTSTSASRLSVNLDYISHLRNRILNPLIKLGMGGINEAVDIMHDYKLSREDLDGILELSHWKGSKDPSTLVDSKVKAAFTRTYNKDTSFLPYVPPAPVKKKVGADLTYNEEESLLEDDVEEDNDDITKDSMIKVKKPKAGKGKVEASTSETKARKRRNDEKKGEKGKKNFRK